MKIEVDVKKKYVFIILGALLVFSVIIGAYASVDKTIAWHGAETVEINIGGEEMSLQEAIDGGEFISKGDVVWFGNSGFLLKEGAEAETVYYAGSSVGNIRAYAKKEEGKIYLKIKYDGVINNFWGKTCDWEEVSQLECIGYAVYHGGTGSVRTTAKIELSGVELVAVKRTDTLTNFVPGQSSGLWN